MAKFVPNRILSLEPDWVRTQVRAFLHEDAPDGDITTAVSIPDHAQAIADLVAEDEMVFAGAHLIPNFFGDSCRIEWMQNDGDIVKAGATIGRISGPARTLLTGERVLLNLLQRLCGIATLTRQFVERIRPHNVKILDTRKTTPGLRLFEKYAVAVGGGYNHRLDLSSAILIKDNHVKIMKNLRAAISRARIDYPHAVVELEVETPAEVRAGLDAVVDALLLDNMNPQEVAAIVRQVRDALGDTAPFLEVSGGITLETVAHYAATGIDGISIGALTHGVASKNIRLDIV